VPPAHLPSDGRAHGLPLLWLLLLGLLLQGLLLLWLLLWLLGLLVRLLGLLVRLHCVLCRRGTAAVSAANRAAGDAAEPLQAGRRRRRC
jgi:hypothetical protein